MAAAPAAAPTATVVIFDCESDGRPRRHAGGADFSHVQCTCACAIVVSATVDAWTSGEVDLGTALQITCWRDICTDGGPFEPLLAAFDAADLIVGYNSLDFDMPLLQKHYSDLGRYMRHRIKSLDIFSRVRAVTGLWPKLDALLMANGLQGKSGDGAHAVLLWEADRREELAAYCMQDVLVTAQLAMLPQLQVANHELPGHVFGAAPALLAVVAGK